MRKLIIQRLKELFEIELFTEGSYRSFYLDKDLEIYPCSYFNTEEQKKAFANMTHCLQVDYAAIPDEKLVVVFEYVIRRCFKQS